ncbi:MAG: DUF2891 domain-containing protein [Flavobacteriaceae bacterium]|nr:DUF2891 domain-containing protein [Flavobacteriaceae bacterium]
MLLFLILSFMACTEKEQKKEKTTSEATSEIKTSSAPNFNEAEATSLLKLPLKCIDQQYPYKPGTVLESENDLKPPKEHFPVFYGCFDWHSAVHGYWSMITLIKTFPEMEDANRVKEILKTTLTKENMLVETAFFERSVNASFERTYGWNWFLKLAEELYTWDDPLGQELYQNVEPLADLFVERYKEFLPKLVYPIRVGEHTNTAFGLTFAYDYAVTTGDNALRDLIKSRAKEFYFDDENCPINWEPSGFDFLSPCFEEINIMRRVLDKDEFLPWLDRFMPQLKDKSYLLEVGQVSDREDGKLVHLDGLNFSRAWSLYALANGYEDYEHLKNVAHGHMNYSLPNLVDDSYEGGHWLGSFAIYSLLQLQDEATQ